MIARPRRLLELGEFVAIINLGSRRDVERTNDGNGDEARPFRWLVAVELNRVEVEGVDSVEEEFEGRVLENAHEEGFARVGCEAGGLKGEPVRGGGGGGLATLWEKGVGNGGTRQSRADGGDDALGDGDRDGASACRDEDES